MLAAAVLPPGACSVVSTWLDNQQLFLQLSSSSLIVGNLYTLCMKSNESLLLLANWN